MRLGRRAPRPSSRLEEMAVRRQLRQLLQDPQPIGVIVVERAPAATACVAGALPPLQSSSSCSMPPPVPPPPPSSPPPVPPPPPPPPSSPPPPPPPSSPPPPPPPSSPPPSPPRRRGPLPEDCAVFHCRGCWTVLGDSLQLCGQEPAGLSILICFKVTRDVVQEDSVLVGLEGALLGCTYYLLSCRSCGLVVGFILYSSGSDLAYLRDLFCFFKDSIMCYLLKNQMIIEASKVNFPAVTLTEHMDKMKEKLVDLCRHLQLVIRKLEKLEKNNGVTELQNSSTDLDDLEISEYAGVNAN